MTDASEQLALARARFKAWAFPVGETLPTPATRPASRACRVAGCGHLLDADELETARLCRPCQGTGDHPHGGICGACHGFGVTPRIPAWLLDRIVEGRQ